MNLLPFLESFFREKLLSHSSVLYFVGKSYPLLFFSYFVSSIRKLSFSVQRIDVTEFDSELLKAQFSTITFGGSIVYWLSNFHLLTPKKQQEWSIFMQSYDGPHVLLFFVENNVNASFSSFNHASRVSMITIPDVISAQDFSLIKVLVQKSYPFVLTKGQTHFSTNLVNYFPVLTIDTACLLAQYELVVGKNIDEFFTQWSSHLTDATSSLFLLSQHFFSKNKKLFFAQWARIADTHNATFWVSFWADQLWRAYIYCSLMKEKNYDDAKRAQYKLPYSFINRDWRRYQLYELKNAHHFLFDADFSLKNGGSEIVLDLFYAQFFENKLIN